MPKKQSKNKVRQNNQRKSKGRKMSSRRGNLKNKKNKSKLSYKKRPAKGGSNDHDPTTPEHWKHIFSEEFAKQYEEKGFKYYLFDKFKKLPLDSLDSLERGIEENIFDCSALELIRASIPLLLEKGIPVQDEAQRNILEDKLEQIVDKQTDKQFECMLETFKGWPEARPRYTVELLEGIKESLENDRKTYKDSEVKRIEIHNKFLKEIDNAIKAIEDEKKKKLEERQLRYEEREREGREQMFKDGKSGLAGAWTR